jgi:hypothetical protein
LDEDGLAERWQEGIRSDWEGELGENYQPDMQGFVIGRGGAMPSAIQRLHNPSSSRQFGDSSGMGRGEDGGDDLCGEESDTVHHGFNPILGAEVDPEGVRVVRNLTLDYFCKRLIEHFDIMFERHEIVWPSRNGHQRRLVDS